MKGQVPGRVPRIFPLVGHGNDVFVVEMDPVVIPPGPAFRRRWGECRIAFQPVGDDEVVELLGPEHVEMGVIYPPLEDPQI